MNISRKVYETDVIDTLFHGTQPEKCSPELAHQMIYASIEYAAQFGFQPDADFALTQNILEPRGELTETEQFHLPPATVPRGIKSNIGFFRTFPSIGGANR